MPRYRIFYLKDSKVSAYREATPVQRPCRLKKRNYEVKGEIEAPSPYAAWKSLQGEGAEQRGLRALGVGDALLEAESSSLTVCNFGGFDEAEWDTPKTVQPSEGKAAFPSGTSTGGRGSSDVSAQQSVADD